MPYICLLPFEEKEEKNLKSIIYFKKSGNIHTVKTFPLHDEETKNFSNIFFSVNGKVLSDEARLSK